MCTVRNVGYSHVPTLPWPNGLSHHSILFYLWGTKCLCYKFCLVFMRLLYISTFSIITIAWKHKATKGVHIVALDPSYRPMPSVPSYSTKIHSFSCLCCYSSVRSLFQRRFYTGVELLFLISISRTIPCPLGYPIAAYVFFVPIFPLFFLL